MKDQKSFDEFKTKYPIGTVCEYTESAKNKLIRMFGKDCEGLYLGPLEIVGYIDDREEDGSPNHFLSAEHGFPVTFGVEVNFIETDSKETDPTPIGCLTNFRVSDFKSKMEKINQDLIKLGEQERMLMEEARNLLPTGTKVRVISELGYGGSEPGDTGGRGGQPFTICRKHYNHIVERFKSDKDLELQILAYLPVDDQCRVCKEEDDDYREKELEYQSQVFHV